MTLAVPPEIFLPLQVHPPISGTLGRSNRAGLRLALCLSSLFQRRLTPYQTVTLPKHHNLVRPLPFGACFP